MLIGIMPINNALEEFREEYDRPISDRCLKNGLESSTGKSRVFWRMLDWDQEGAMLGNLLQQLRVEQEIVSVPWSSHAL